MRHSLFILATTVCLAMCTSKVPEEEVNEIQQTPGADSPSTNVCYAYAKNEDIIGLTLNSNTDNKVSGKLAYALAEKDRSSGTLEGYWKGDTLIADYSFHAEGRLSVREMVFVRRGDVLVEAYGDVEQVGNKTTFKSRKDLKFLDNFPLSRVPCRKEELITN